MTKAHERELRVLMVDDSADDIFFVQRALRASGLEQSLNSVKDGEEAIAYVRGEGEFAKRDKFPFPNVILCDLKMPGIDGFGFLKWLRSHPECSVVPVIIFSSSAVEKDVKEAYRLGANSYMVKPTVNDDLVDLIQLAFAYWSRCERPPSLRNC